MISIHILDAIRVVGIPRSMTYGVSYIMKYGKNEQM